MAKEIYDPEYVLVGEKLVCIGRKISKPTLISRVTAKHRARQVVVEGTAQSPARCYISKPARIIKQKL